MSIRNLSLALCLLALLTFAIAGCNNGSDSGTAYWNTSDGTSSPTVTSVTGTLVPGSQCTVAGTNFGSSRDNGSSYVMFVPTTSTTSGIKALGYLSWSSTSITCITPSLTSGVSYIVVVYRVTSSTTYYSSTTSSSSNTTTATSTTGTAPAISAQSPTSATAGSAVTLTGTNFPTSNGWVTVAGTAITSGTTFTSTSVVFTVPSGTATGAAVLLGGGANGISNSYSLVIGGSSTVPTITNLSSTSAAIGDTITVTGTGFVSGATTVMLGTTSATTVTVASTTSLTFVVPTVTTGSSYVVYVTTAAGTSTSTSYAVTVYATGSPIVTSATSVSTTGGTSTLTGTGFTGVTYVGYCATATGTFTTMTYTAGSATSMTVTVPALTAGSYFLKLTNAVGSATTGTAVLTVASGQVFSSVNPTSAAVGDTITLVGSGFTSTLPTVTIGGTSVTPTYVSATAYTCVVPTGLSGTVVVSVTFSGASAQTQNLTISGGGSVAWHTAAAASDNTTTGVSIVAGQKIKSVVLSSGNIVSIFQEYSTASGRQGLYVRTLNASAGTWDTPVQIDDRTLGAALAPSNADIATSGGNIIVVFEQNNEIWSRWFANGGTTWSPDPSTTAPRQVNNTVVMGARAGTAYPRVEFDALGQPVCVYANAPAALCYSILNITTNVWTGNATIVTTAMPATSRPDLAFFSDTTNKSGYIVVADKPAAIDTRAYFVKVVTTGGAAPTITPGALTAIDFAGGAVTDICANPSIKLSGTQDAGKGAIIFNKVYTSGTAGNYVYVSKYSTTTATFNAIAAQTDSIDQATAPAVTINTAGFTNPQIVLLSGTQMLAVYSVNTTVGGRIYAHRYDGSTWLTGTQIQATGGDDLAYAANLAADSTGTNAFVVMTQNNSTATKLKLYVSKFASNAWTMQTVANGIDDASGTALQPTVANTTSPNLGLFPNIMFGSTTNALVLFLEQDNAGVDKVYYNRYY